MKGLLDKHMRTAGRLVGIKSLNVSMIIIIFMPLGWGIISAILALETLLFYLFLKRRVSFAVNLGFLAVSNLLSGLAGLGLSLLHNGGWYGVFWFPWVSSHEIDLSQSGAMGFFILYFCIAFVVTMLVEVPLNILLYRRKGIGIRETVRVSLAANVITNIGCALVVYLFSFR